MSQTLYRILGKKGRITIPYELRQQVGFGYNDILSFTQQDGNTLIIKKEKLCNNCQRNTVSTDAWHPNMTIMELLDSLTPAQQRAALIHLSVKWAEQHDRNKSRRAVS